MSSQQNSLLRNIWYYALPASKLKAGTMTGKLLLGEPILFVRKSDNSVFALRDVCPHRGIPLRYGRLDGNEVECCYHGWKFNDKGICTCIPSLTGQEGLEPGNFLVRSYPVRESQGGIWVYMSESRDLPENLPPVPALEDFPADMQPVICETLRFPCFIDHAVIGLMDPAHGPFVHTSWWWRSRKSIYEKAKPFGPSYLGFTMKRHRPSSNSFAYKVLGGAPATEISFQLPGIRLESIHAGANRVGGLTCVTPISETETEITHVIYTNIGWLRIFAPIARLFAKRFLGQDRDVVVKQQYGLKYEQNLMLIRDADTQARWYMQIKNEFARAQAEKRAFENPVKDVTLRWRS